MSRPAQLPVSELIKHGKKAGEEDQATKRKRNDFREMKDLEEQRKAGTAPAMVDIETGRDINPHIPEFIEKTPWYVATDGPTLKHQRPHEERQRTFANINEWYAKGTTNKVASKFRKGACENCGAMGHKKNECFDRPRKLTAKYTEADFAPDDYVQPDLSLNYDAKRDRWNGFDPSTYSETVVKEHEEMAEIAKIIKAEKIKKDGSEVVVVDPEKEGTEVEADVEVEEEEEVDEDKYADEMAPAQTMDMDSRTRITVRNLRIREDTAKYLYNLNENGPYYDPKSRSMRENPFLGVPGKEAEAAQFSGENYVRYTGEVVKANEAQLFAWQARSKGIDVHASAEPTKLEFLQKKFDEQRHEIKDTNMKNLLESYGGEEYLEAPAKELLLAQSENYVEYNRRGKIIKGEDRPLLKSKYEEDQYINNHTSIWGSYYKNGKWGFKCCHAFMKNSYCVGSKGYANDTETFTRMPATALLSKQIKPKPAEAMKVAEKPEITEVVGKEENKNKKQRKNKGSQKSSESSSSSSSSAESEGEPEMEKMVGPEITEDDVERQKQMEEEMEKEKEKRAKKEHQRKVKREKRKRQKDRKREKREKEGKDGGRKKRKRNESPSSSSSSEEDDSDSEVDSKKKKFDPELRAAIKKVMKEQKDGKVMKQMDDRERKYHSQYETPKAPTEAEKEAYNLIRILPNDPMASYMSKK